MWIDFRGQEVEIDFKDSGYEPDTNAHDIEWWFVDFEYDDLSPDEEAIITSRIANRTIDRLDDDVI